MVVQKVLLQSVLLSEARLNKANALKIEKEIEREFGVKESEEGILETV